VPSHSIPGHTITPRTLGVSINLVHVVVSLLFLLLLNVASSLQQNMFDKFWISLMHYEVPKFRPRPSSFTANNNVITT